MLIITEFLIEGCSTITSSTLSISSQSVGFVISSSAALLTIIALLITNEYISSIKKRYTKLRDWINVVTLQYEKTLKCSMVNKKSTKQK